MYIDIPSQELNDDDTQEIQRMEMDMSVQVCMHRICRYSFMFSIYRPFLNWLMHVVRLNGKITYVIQYMYNLCYF